LRQIDVEMPTPVFGKPLLDFVKEYCTVSVIDAGQKYSQGTFGTIPVPSGIAHQ
jgi:hypothetical protein